jgi:plasmid stabilization system protein ParE
MRVRWTAEARSDLARLYGFLAPVNRGAAARAVQSLRTAAARPRDHPRLGSRLDKYVPREVRRMFAGDYELRYQIEVSTIIDSTCGTPARTADCGRLLARSGCAVLPPPIVIRRGTLIR